MKRARVLVVDDDVDILSLLHEVLETSGYEVYGAANGREGLRALYGFQPDVVLLDVAMPQLDGWLTLDRIRDLSDVPVLMLTARTAVADKVRGLRGGADDYVTKPFDLDELLARVEALLRRSWRSSDLPEAYEDERLRVDFVQRRVTVYGREVAFTPLEFRLLAAFVRHPNQVLSRERLLELVWRDPNGVSPDQVKLYVAYVRRKLEAAGRPGEVWIETLRGFGYRYRVADVSAQTG
jgi:DNA-binding response OmpR family regulator